MNKFIIQISICIIFFAKSWAQEHGKFALSINYGVNGSFFVRSYSESGPGIQFYKKNFIGTSGGGELKYRLNKRSAIALGYMQSNNKRVVDFFGTNNNISLDIWSFTIRHTEHIYYAGYEYNLLRHNVGLRLQGGGYYVKPVQQEIELTSNRINIWERKKSNTHLNDLGVYMGVQYSHAIDTHFDLGVQSRIFYEVTTGILSQVTLTPTLIYHFSKSKRKKSP
jgi:hypothetical protein